MEEIYDCIRNQANLQNILQWIKILNKMEQIYFLALEIRKIYGFHILLLIKNVQMSHAVKVSHHI